MLIKAKDDLIREDDVHDTIPEGDWVLLEQQGKVNWRPRKTYMDEEYIGENPESIVFYSDVKECIELFEISSPTWDYVV